jgi:m7GpppX diphosphatase
VSAEARAALMAKHVARSSAAPARLLRETPALYAAAHAPLVAAAPKGALQWVYNILAKEKEAERLLVDAPGDDGFLINVDPKVRDTTRMRLQLRRTAAGLLAPRAPAPPQWSSHPACALGGDRAAWHGHAAVRDLYVLGLCNRRDVASLRDLRAAHLPMLRGLRAAALAAIQRTYGVPPDQARQRSGRVTCRWCLHADVPKPSKRGARCARLCTTRRSLRTSTRTSPRWASPSATAASRSARTCWCETRVSA